MTDAPIRDDNERIHGWFGLTYANYLTLPRTLLQSMPSEWQTRFVDCLEELGAAFWHVETADTYKVDAAREVETYCCSKYTEIQPCHECPMAMGGGDTCGGDEDDPCDDACDMRECGEDRRQLEAVSDPVPHYQRGRTYLPPDLDAVNELIRERHT